MDIKAARVKKLETQLKEIAYGTRPYRLDTSKFEYGGLGGIGVGAVEEGEEVVELERGQNLLQFHISVVSGVALTSLISGIVTNTLYVCMFIHVYVGGAVP